MSFDVSHRDRHGFLKGSFGQGWFVWPIEVLADVVPFLFPCQKCAAITLHVAAEQHAGLGVKLPFASQPLASTGRAYHALCNDCTTINSQLDDMLIGKLRLRVLPAQFCNLFQQVCKPDVPPPYSASFIDGWLAGIPEGRPDLRAAVGRVLKTYAPETDPGMLRQTLCKACGERVTPITKRLGFFARMTSGVELFPGKPIYRCTCPKCGEGVETPALV